MTDTQHDQAPGGVVSTGARPSAPERATDAPGSGASDTPGRRTRLIVFALLCLGALLAFAPLRHAEFLAYDDDIYVTNNQMTRHGITWNGIVWAWSYAAFNWHPLTWLSHMLDTQLFGLNAGAHHLVSVLLHVANSALLLYVLQRLTRAFWPSVFVAALFAVHPLHVEPVAWISARKDLLSTWWWFAALLAYVRYTERPTWRRYGLVGLCLLVSLLCKGMAITLPFLLLLLDYWPLRRGPGTAATGAERAQRRWDLLREKVPLLLIAIAGMLVQVIAQQLSSGWRSLDEVPVSLRLANAVISYAAYIGKMFWPVGLAIPYPLHPELPPLWQTAGALLGLVLASALVARFGRDRRYLVTGWLWYLITLLPVIGLISIGAQSMADRYTYVALLGPFMMIAWGAADAARQIPRLQPFLSAAAGGLLLLCASLTRHQVGYWQDTLTLFRHTLESTTENTIAEINYASAAAIRGLRDESFAHYAEALRISPESTGAHFGLAIVLIEDGQLAAAEEHLRAVLRTSPNFAGAHMRLGRVLFQQGRTAEAREHYESVVAAEPTNSVAHFRIAQLAEAEGQWSEALAGYEHALQLDSTIEGGHFRLARALRVAGRSAEAVNHYREALRRDPNDGDAENDLGALLQEMGQTEEARQHFEAALRINPADAEAHNNLGVLLFEGGQVASAEAHVREALRVKPNYAGAHVNLGMIRLQQGDPAAAEEHFRAALALEPENAGARDGLAQARAAGRPGLVPE